MTEGAGDRADWPAVLGRLIAEEHANLPVGTWGFFFPVTVALWRFFNLRADNALGEVHAAATDCQAALASRVEIIGGRYVVHRGPLLEVDDPQQGPAFFGSGAAWLVARLEQEPLLSAVDAVAHAILQGIPRQRALRGGLRPADIAPMEPALLRRLADAAEQALLDYPPPRRPSGG